MSTIRTTVGSLRRAVGRILVNEIGSMGSQARRGKFPSVVIEREIPGGPDGDGSVVEIKVEYSVVGEHIPETWLSPAEYPEVEIVGATLFDGTPVELTPEEESYALDIAQEREDSGGGGGRYDDY